MEYFNVSEMPLGMTTISTHNVPFGCGFFLQSKLYKLFKYALSAKLPCICIVAHVSRNVFITVYVMWTFCWWRRLWFTVCCQKSIWPLNRFNKILPGSLMTAANWRTICKTYSKQMPKNSVEPIES